jgi:demethylmenaquinone methyltransferase / 2-methoxy-6-polyprenyl-1,4-benzoquinol methylase
MTRAHLDRRPDEVSAMFDRVAERYDLLNDVLSLGQDRWWRRVVARAAGARAGERVLDIAAGTGTSSVSFTAAGADCVACDFSLGMLQVGARRLRPGASPEADKERDTGAGRDGVGLAAEPGAGAGAGRDGVGLAAEPAAGAGAARETRSTPGAGAGPAAAAAPGAGPGTPGRGKAPAARDGRVRFVAGDALRLPFADQAFDVVTISFGLRNVADPDTALTEMLRVTRPGGRLVICEFGHLPWRQLNSLYERYLATALPAVARRLSRNPDAYSYLAESIKDWPAQDGVARRMAAAGWSAVRWRDLTMGIVTVHVARRPG